MKATDMLKAMRADDIPEGEDRLWEVRKHDLYPFGPHTSLTRYTSETIHQSIGECVMVDHIVELRSHLEFALCARGDVLITGLGLGCIARGCRFNPAVNTVTVIERDTSVIRLVARYLPAGITVIQADALQWAKETDRRFDYAWHDLWSDPDTEEPSLLISHAELMISLFSKVQHQGAWRFPRPHRRLLARKGMGLGRRCRFAQFKLKGLTPIK